MKAILKWWGAGMLVFAVAGVMPAQTVQFQRKVIRKVKLRELPAPLLKLAKADFVVRNIHVDMETDCTKNRVFSVKAQVWNIGDADYDAAVKSTNLYWDYSKASSNEPLWFGFTQLPSIPKGGFVVVSHGLTRSMVRDSEKPLLTSSRYFKIAMCPNEQEDFVPEKDFSNNILRHNVQNPCFKMPLLPRPVPRKIPR
ncbi:MAG: hypothetical protein JXA62_00885 [Candidatus Aminicenantes bacterium]|nr:hypothetical protein [Candidatus Aminicenantes bacterium]